MPQAAACVLLVLLAASLPAAQEASPDAVNPLAELNALLKQVLAEAQVPFTDAQERAIALMMEERRRASEELFGGLMDFRGGPTRGQDQDRLQSAIAWMRSEFLRLLADYLTPAQAAVWEAFRTRQGGEAPPEAQETARTGAGETQYVRINSNRFTAEEREFGGSQGTEVIPRGGAGAWHGNAQLLLKDDALNARNALASNEPPYQERRLAIDVSGPTVRGRLTSAFAFTQNESKNVNTVHATLPEGVFALGITRPNVFRQANSRNTLQLADAHSLILYGGVAGESSTNQGVGGFTLPERASDSSWRSVQGEVRQFSFVGARALFEWRLDVNDSHSETTPRSDAVRVNVLDAFGGGGAQNRHEESQRVYQFGALYTRQGDAVTLKTGAEGSHRRRNTVSNDNAGGTFTFSSLADYVAGRPLTYRVTRGTPDLELSQLQASSFLQADLALGRQLTLLVGVRWDTQTNLRDLDNVAPRVAVAYAPGRATVVRAGAGLFYNVIGIGMFENQRRLDGTRQFEIVVNDPSYPDPFLSGAVRQQPRSVRVTDPALEVPYFRIAMVSIERTLQSNLLLTAAYDYQREFHRLRLRNLNAPLDGRAARPRACQPDQPADTCVRPDPSRGEVFNLESTGNEVRHLLRLSARKRFRVANVTASYQLQHALGDVQGGPGTLATDSYDLRADWGPAPFPRHTVGGSVNARLPLGLFLTGTVSGNSGRRYTMTTGFDDNRDSSVTDRPPGVGPNSLRGPRYVNVDVNLSKAFFIGEGTGRNVNVFINATNALNRVHYGTPSGVLTSPNFGRPTSASDPREVEVGLRFQF